MNKKVANFLSLTLFFVGVMAVVVSIVENSPYVYHALALCAVLALIADFISIKAGNKMPNATQGQKRFVLILQAILWTVGWMIMYGLELFHPT